MNAYTGECLQKTVITQANSDKQGNWHYSLISEYCSDINLGEYHTYGIQASGFKCSEILHDVSSCKETVVWMTEFFNRHQLSPTHFKDAVEDMLP